MAKKSFPLLSLHIPILSKAFINMRSRIKMVRRKSNKKKALFDRCMEK
jgi:hypothetical protein